MDFTGQSLLGLSEVKILSGFLDIVLFHLSIQKIWARRAISVAKAQNRFLMLALYLKWLHEIESVNE